MKKLILIVSSFLFFLTFQGCLTFHKISYKLILEDDLAGSGVIIVHDIRSDAETDEEFEEDKNTLFDYILKSDMFLSDMLNEGKDITSRNLFLENNLLNGKTEFDFEDIRDVEAISFEDGFYYLTLELQDSVNSTNGEIIYSEDFKRIVWGKNTSIITFEMIATDFDDMNYRELAPFYKEEN
jgi:hypothetical protein